MRLRCGWNLNDVEMNGFTLVFWWINWLVVIYCLKSLSADNDQWNHPKLNQSFWKKLLSGASETVPLELEQFGILTLLELYCLRSTFSLNIYKHQLSNYLKCQVRLQWTNPQQESIPVECQPPTCQLYGREVRIQSGPSWASLNMGGGCTVRSKFNKFERV